MKSLPVIKGYSAGKANKHHLSLDSSTIRDFNLKEDDEIVKTYSTFRREKSRLERPSKINATMTFAKKKVKELNIWEDQNLDYQGGEHDKLFSALQALYLKENDEDKLDELNQVERIYTSSRTINQSKFLFSKTDGISNKIIENEILNKIKEQASILTNTITKTRNRFGHLLFKKETLAKLTTMFSLDKKIIGAMKNDITINEHRYLQVIEGKNKSEIMMKADFIDLSERLRENKKQRIKVLNKIDYEHLKKKQDEAYYTNVKTQLTEDLSLITEKKKKNRKTFLRQVKSLRLDNQIKNIKIEEVSKMSEFKEKVDCLQSELKRVILEGEFLKFVFTETVKEQREYFLSILKNGFDVRNDGLVWVVKRLMELNYEVTSNDFPKFLDQKEAQYIITQAELLSEENLLLKQINQIKRKHISMVESEFKFVGEEGEYQMKNFSVGRSKKDTFSNLKQTFNSLRDKYKYSFLNHAHETICREEEKTTKLINDSLRSIISGQEQKYKSSHTLVRIMKDEGKVEEFQNLSKLKEKLKDVKNKKLREKKIMIDYIRNIEELMKKNMSIENSTAYDLMYGALFGKEIINK